MQELYELKEKLCDHLKGYAPKEITAGSLEVIDKLTHAIKNLDKIIYAYENEGDYSSDGMMYDDTRRSYARGRKRDSMGRYSNGRSYDRGYSSDMMSELQNMMDNAPDERSRQIMRDTIQRMGH